MKGISSSSYRCYGNLLCQENVYDVFTNDWAVQFDVMIVASSDKEWL